MGASHRNSWFDLPARGRHDAIALATKRGPGPLDCLLVGGQRRAQAGLRGLSIREWNDHRSLAVFDEADAVALRPEPQSHAVGNNGRRRSTIATSPFV
jgi:hypothetical protein